MAIRRCPAPNAQSGPHSPVIKRRTEQKVVAIDDFPSLALNAANEEPLTQQNRSLPLVRRKPRPVMR
ncbi:Uncharacterised protein [Vibrio cholerae]|nr:Uncharacterised protein [Vibrio cholerae]